MATVAEALDVAHRYRQSGHLAEAEYICRQIVASVPDHLEAQKLLRAVADGYNDTGIALARAGRWDEALASLQEALRLQPDHTPALNNQGIVLVQQGRLDEAISSYHQVLRINPADAGAFNNLGNALRLQGKLEDSLAACQQAVHLDPVFVDAHNNLGIAYALLRRYAEAETAFRQALVLKPDHAKALSNLGHVLQNLAVARPEASLMEEAIHAYDRAIALDPSNSEYHWNLARVLLLNGNFLRGWREFEWRLHYEPMALRRDFPQPQWDGSDLTGRTILLHTEGGFGDALQFIRYAPMVAERGGQVVLECQPELKSLLQTVPGLTQVVVRGEPLPPFDVHAPLQSLPLVFGTTLDDIPVRVPYLAVDPALVERWGHAVRNAECGMWSAEAEYRGVSSTDREIDKQQSKISNPLTSRPSPLTPRPSLRVGLVWSGRRKDGEPHDPACPFEKLWPLAEVPGVAYYSLQKDKTWRKAENDCLPLKITDWTEELNDFAQTAALMVHMDLVISVDTSVAHLAGALGKPVWVALPLLPDFRWLLWRHDSPWYPTMRLFRQKTLGGWDEVIERIARELAVFSSQPSAQQLLTKH